MADADTPELSRRTKEDDVPAEPGVLSRLGHGLVASALRVPWAEMLVGGGLGALESGLRPADRLKEFHRAMVEERARKAQQAQIEALGGIAGLPPEKIKAAAAAGLDPRQLMPQYQVGPEGSIIEQDFGQPPKLTGEKLPIAPAKGQVVHAPGMPMMRVDAQGNAVPVLGPDGKPIMQPFKPNAPRAGAEHYEEKREDAKEGQIRVMLTQRRNLLAGALTPADRATRAQMLPPLDEQIEAAISDLSPARQARWRKLFVSAQKATATPATATPAISPASVKAPGQSWTDWANSGKEWVRGHLPGGAQAQPVATPSPAARIRVRRKSDGQTGSVPAAEFDAALYDRME